MANAKSRLNAPKSAANKKKVGKTKSLAGRKEAAKNNNNNEAIIRRLTDNVTVLSTDDKVQLLLENGPQLKDKFVLKTVPKLPKKPLPPSPKVIAEVKTQPSVRDRLITKSGRIVKKSKSDLKLMDNILKSELLIELNGDKNKKNKNNPNDKNTSSNNNNDMEITNQNDADLGASGTNSEDATNTTKNVQNGKDPTKP
ncbi:putative mediator of RNA polymerase II transcription subunit 7, partial [Manduca sexta]